MEHSVEIEVYKLVNPQDETYNEVPLEIQFDLDEGSALITGFFIDGVRTGREQLVDANPTLDKQIDRAIDKYVANLD